MTIFAPAKSTQAYLKAGLMGFAGSGKTFTSSHIAIGLHKELVERQLLKADVPVFFFDTETGSDFVRPLFDKAGVPLHSVKTRAFSDLCAGIDEIQDSHSVLIIDSISHVWGDLQNSYENKNKRKFGLTIRDWMIIKKMWRSEYTERFVNSPLHILMCGRAGWEFGFSEGEDGKRELEKTGLRFLADKETGFEPSLLIYMDQNQEVHGHKVKITREATILKDRTDTIDGKTFKQPRYRHFLPHIKCLNLGGEHLGVDGRTSEHLIERPDNRPRVEARQKEITLDEIQAILVKHYPSQTKDDKTRKADLMEKHFQSRSWERIKEMSYHELRRGFNTLHAELEGRPADLYNEPVEAGQPGNEIDTSEVEAPF